MSLYNNIFDAHAHYDDKWFDDDRFELLENIHTKGVCGIVNNAVNLETAKTAGKEQTPATESRETRSDEKIRQTPYAGFDKSYTIE